MDIIEFRTDHADSGPVAEILINSVLLSKLAGDYELPRYKLDSGYLGLPLSDVTAPSKHFLGHPHSHYIYDERVQVLGCGCGEPGCWPLVCRIDLGAYLVTWYDFLQPFRDTDSAGGHWSYDGFGPFVFARRQYESALMALGSSGGA